MSHFYNVLILGGGGSGLSLAIKLKQAGVKSVGIISKTSIMGSHTSAAKGGINASLGNVEEDDYKWHAFDTLTSAQHMAEEERVNFMCKQAPKEIEFLSSLGVKFDVMENGKINQRRYGGQKTHYGKGGFAYRACFKADETGQEIMQNLYSAACKMQIKMHEFCFAFKARQGCVTALNLQTGKTEGFAFNIVVFAGGGFSQNYYTNSSSNALTGDAHILAMQLGAKLEDAEFTQFHPTGLYGTGILISEAVRAEGGFLLNEKGERFMQKYSPSFMELASRDVITKAIFEETGGVKPAFLSLRHLNRQMVMQKLKGTVQTAKFFGKIDVFTQDIPVFPTAHYNMGGIKVDANYKVEGVENAFAIGECAGARIHGANRLGCNSLLELFTSSTLAANAILNIVFTKKEEKAKPYPINNLLKNKNKLSFECMQKIKLQLSKTMQEKCGVIKNEEEMKRALTEVMQIQKLLQSSSPIINSFVFSNEFVLYMEVLNLTALSLITIKAAIKRKESRGSHIRSDFVELNTKYNRS